MKNILIITLLSFSTFFITSCASSTCCSQGSCSKECTQSCCANKDAKSCSTDCQKDCCKNKENK